MKKHGIKIQMFLVDGTPEGLRLVNKDNWNGQAISCSRAQYPDASKRPEFQRPGVYVLIGEPDGPGLQPLVYVGEADNLRTRVNQQQRDKDFWTRLVAFTSTDKSLNKAHVRYLEARLVLIGYAAKRAQIENAKPQKLPHLAEDEIASMETFLDHMLLICPTLGLTAFDIPTKTLPLGKKLRLEGPDASAEGQDTPEGFRVFAGSAGRAEMVPSMRSYHAAKREELVASGVLAQEGEKLRLTQDYLFDSPSQAAALLLGRPANGRAEWKDAAGRTLKEIQEQAIQSG